MDQTRVSDVTCSAFSGRLRVFKGATVIIRVGRKPWPETSANHYHVQQDIGCAIKRVSYLKWLGSKAFEPAKRSGPRLLQTVPCGINLSSMN